MTDDVMAVEYKNVPTIGNKASDEKTKAEGVQYDLDSDKETITAAVLGVNSFRYFGNVDNKSGLITKMSYKPKNDVYVIEATIAGESETEFTTIDADDVDMTGVKDLDTMYDELTKGDDAKNGLYAEMDFNADGKIVGIDLMNQPAENKATVAGTTDRGVARVVINRVSTQNRILASQAISAGNDKVYTNDAQTVKQDFEITDSTKYYEVDADLEFPANGDMLNPYKDAFAKEFRLKDISEGDVSDLDSFIRDTAEDEDEYVVADVIYDDGDAVAVYYYKDTVAEASDVLAADVVEDVKMVALTAANKVVATDVKVDGVTANNGDVTVKVMKGDNEVEGASVTAALANGTVTLTTTAETVVGDYTVVLSKTNYNDVKIPFTVEKATVDLKDSSSTLGNIKVSAKVDGKAIDLDNTSALSVQVVKANTTEKIDVEGTWSFDRFWRFAPAADAGLVAGDTLYISAG